MSVKMTPAQCPPEIASADLPRRLGFAQPLIRPAASMEKPLSAWQMELDDAPIFRYIYRSFRPARHLEFGTWEGTGALYCLEECDATVWTINLLEGELKNDGNWSYSQKIASSERPPGWSNEKVFGDNRGASHWFQTDARGFIGRRIHERGLGHRVCQIYCDSRKWDISQYPEGIFDTALIDGGHLEDVVESDTRKALKLLRPGGLAMWHDYCPRPDINVQCPSTRGVVNAISKNWSWISEQCRDIFWINPSWILLGVKK